MPVDAVTGGTRQGSGPSPRWIRGRRNLGWLLAVASLVAVAGVLLPAPGAGPQLSVTDADTGSELLRRPLAVDETFALVHTHSVTRREVVETFSVNAERVLTLDSMTFDQPGPNLPVGPEPFGDGMTSFTTVDGVYRVDHHRFPIGRVTLRVGREDVDHTLVFGDGRQVRLLTLTRAGGPVELQVVKGWPRRRG